MNRPKVRDSKAEDNPYGGRFYNGTESLIVIDTKLLRISADNPPCLVASRGSIKIELILEDPFSIYNVGTQRTENERPPGGQGMRDQVPLATKALHSSVIA